MDQKRIAKNLIFVNYTESRKVKSDINELLPHIVRFAQDVEHVTEFGVRDVVSTWALLAAYPKALRSYDIVTCPTLEMRAGRG